MKLTILHTNDVHGRLDRLPRLSTLIQRERALARSEGRRVLILDAGDSSAKSSRESLATQGRANFVLLEAMGYQASTLGNRDVKWGAAALARLVASVSFPVLAANLVRLADDQALAVPGLRSFALVDLDDFPIGIVGLTAWTGYDHSPHGYRAVNGASLLRGLTAQARSEGARAVVLLSHLGYSVDSRLASTAEAEGLAAIVGGHSHVSLDPPVEVNHLPIAQAGAYGEYLGRLDLELDPETGRTVEFAGRLIRCDSRIPPDGTISATLELIQQELPARP